MCLLALRRSLTKPLHGDAAPAQLAAPARPGEGAAPKAPSRYMIHPLNRWKLYWDWWLLLLARCALLRHTRRALPAAFDAMPRGAVSGAVQRGDGALERQLPAVVVRRRVGQLRRRRLRLCLLLRRRLKSWLLRLLSALVAVAAHAVRRGRGAWQVRLVIQKRVGHVPARKE